jgi:hypothetical protein
VRTGLHVVAEEATDAPRPIAIETAKTSQSFFKFPLLLKCSLTKGSTIIAALNSATIRVVFAPNVTRLGRGRYFREPRGYGHLYTQRSHRASFRGILERSSTESSATFYNVG